jgi:hypothetical protein
VISGDIFKNIFKNIFWGLLAVALRAWRAGALPLVAAACSYAAARSLRVRCSLIPCRCFASASVLRPLRGLALRIASPPKLTICFCLFIFYGSSQFFGKYALRHSSPQAKASGYLWLSPLGAAALLLNSKKL